MKTNLVCGLTAAFAVVVCLSVGAADSKTSQPKLPEFRVPYRLAPTNHTVVRTKINGKGPFSFIVDTGAPAMFITPALAKQLGIKMEGDNWGRINRIEVEGGPVAENVRVRVEVPFQISTMNQMGLTSGQVEGVIGFTFLARYKIEYDFTRPYMVWTDLNFDPGQLAPTKELLSEEAIKQVQQFNKTMETQTTMMSGMLGGRGNPQLPRPGYLGIEFETACPPVRIAFVHKGSPAEAAGLKKGDVILEIGTQTVRTTDDVMRLSPTVTQGKTINLKVQRNTETLSVAVKASSGF